MQTDPHNIWCWFYIKRLFFIKQNVTSGAGGINLHPKWAVSSPQSVGMARWCKIRERERDSQQMVSHLGKNLPFGLQTVLPLLTNQVPQVPVGCAGPPPAPASGPAFEIMTVIVMSSSLLPPGRREVKLPMENSHPTHSTSSSRIYHQRLFPLQFTANTILKLKLKDHSSVALVSSW